MNRTTTINAKQPPAGPSVSDEAVRAIRRQALKMAAQLKERLVAQARALRG